MKSEFPPERVMELYARGVSFKENLNLYETVRRNERFYTGDQWYGLKVKKIQPVVLNVLRRVVGTFQAMVVSDDIAFEITPFTADEGRETIGKALEEAVKAVIEKQKIKTKNRKCIRTGATTGDMCMYFWFDPDVETGQQMKGDIAAEVLLGTNVIFGNPYTADVQKQPYIILAQRRPAEEVRREAREAGNPDWERIESDSGQEYLGEEDGCTELCTVLTVLWKTKKPVMDEELGVQTGTRACVCFKRVAGKVELTGDTETGMSLYPVAWANWLERLNCMHGISPITEAIPTQIAINKQATNIISFTRNLAFPKIVYDSRKFPNGWDSSPGTAVAVAGNPQELVTNLIGGVNMPAGVVNVLQLMIDLMKDCLGASDATLGNVRPENTSAILAAQSASNAPLELQNRTFEQFNEDCIRIIVDMMCAYYGERVVMVRQRVTDPMTGMETEEEVPASLDATPDAGRGTMRAGGEALPAALDFGALDFGAMDINVEVGAASYWSQTLAVTNLDRLMEQQLLPDVLTYFENIPAQLLPNKREIIRKAREKMQREAAQQAAQPQALSVQNA